jgi:SAM-dependent methyltransferase
MDKFDNWHEFWDKFLLTRYGKESVNNEEDLYLQVARTVNKRPVEKHVFDNIVAQIIVDLNLEPGGVLVDFCCGNGLFTYELKDRVKEIIGVDFSQSIIETAKRYKSAPNITYCLGGVVEFLEEFKKSWPGTIPTKYLMNDSLAYFSSDDLKSMLSLIKGISTAFTFLTRGVPNERLKWNYYNTDERRRYYEGLVAKGDLTNDGLGKWWEPDDIMTVCNELDLKCTIRDQQLPLSDYRMDIIISS